MTGLLQLSGAIVDLVYKPGRLPASSQEVESKIALMTAGGGFNAMVAAKRMGAHVTYGGTLGSGPFAAIVAAAISGEGIALGQQQKAESDQGSCVVIVEDNGERSFITHHGAERLCSLAHLEAQQADTFEWLLLTGYSLYAPASAEIFAAWLGILPKGPKLLFDPGPTVAEIAPVHLNAALARADWVSANRDEAAVLAPGLVPQDAAAVLAQGRGGAIVRNGSDGCYLSCAGASAIHIPGFEVKAVDSNGAGDTHVGVFIASMMQHDDAASACSRANAAAALSTLSIGPATAPTAAEVLQFTESRKRHVPHRHGNLRVRA